MEQQTLGLVDVDVLNARFDRLEQCITKAQPLVLTVRQTASLLQLHEQTVRLLIADGKLKKLSNVGSKILIPRSSLDDFLAAGLAD